MMEKHEVSKCVKEIFETKQLADCKFKVGKEPEQEIIEAHKLILAISSPVFKDMFYGEKAEKNDPIQVTDIQPATFEALLDYIYTENIKLEPFWLACELCYCANKYEFPFLEAECTKFVLNKLSVERVCPAYELFKRLEKLESMKKCLEIIRTQTDKVLKEQSFENIESETLLMILEQDELRITSEIELFYATERWAKAECVRRGLDTEDEEESMRSVLKDALTKIRFLTLTLQEFAEISANSSLLEKRAIVAIFGNIYPGKLEYPMPERFSTNMEKRTTGQRLDIEIMQQHSRTWQGEWQFIVELENRGFLHPLVKARGGQAAIAGPFTPVVEKDDALGPLPAGWERHTVYENRVLYVNYENKTTQWEDPRTQCQETRTDEPTLTEGFSTNMNENGVEEDLLNTFETTGTDSLHNGETGIYRDSTRTILVEGNQFDDAQTYYCNRMTVPRRFPRGSMSSRSSFDEFFSVDKRIWLIGIRIPSQIRNDDSFYPESLKVELRKKCLCSDAIATANFMADVKRRTLNKVIFKQPQLIEKNTEYILTIIFERGGSYPIFPCRNKILCGPVLFTFYGCSPYFEKQKLISSITFTPQR